VSRTAREVNLSTRAARERLKPSGKPYYRSLDQGLHLGYRKGVRGAAWVTRWYVGAEVYKVESLEGRPDDVLEADGVTVLSQSRCCWKKSDHSWRFARAAKAAGENPAVVTIYVGRGHSSIVRELRASIPVRVVAVNHDTRVVTIERTYSRYIGDHADVLARKALLDLAATPSSYVVPIAAGR
jgi:hypothetical protein